MIPSTTSKMDKHVSYTLSLLLRYSLTRSLTHVQADLPDTTWRTSTQVFLSNDGDRVVEDIDRKVAKLTKTNTNQQEYVQVLRYIYLLSHSLTYSLTSLLTYCTF